MKKNFVYLNIHTVISTYKIIFSNGEIISCTKMDNIYFDGRVLYEHANGQPLYAIVKARSEDEARSIASEIIDEVANGEAASI